ncbi:MAG: hypothetical protein P8183_07385 [Anaerolineae bacterium]
MFRRFYWIGVLILLLSLPALACGVFGGNEAEPTAVPEAAPAQVEEPAPTAAAEPTAAPTAVPETAEEPTAEAPATAEESATEAPALPESALSLNAIEELPFNSYRVTMAMEVTGTDADGADVDQGINADMAFSKEPPATDISISFFGLQDEMGDGTIEMTQVEGVSYMVVPEMGCVTTSSEDILADNPFASMLNPDEFLNDLGDIKYEGEETINDIRSLHYSFDKFALTGTDAADIKSAEGHVYIAKDGNFLVRMVVDAQGQVDMFDGGLTDDGVMHLEINLTDVDQPIDVSIPEACAAQDGTGGANSEFPMLEDATNVTSFAGVLSYQTAQPVEDILAFYDEALTVEGWVKDEEGSFVASGSALVNYTREGVTLNVTVSPNEDGGGGNYVILVSDAGQQ